MRNLYEILEITPDATDHEIKLAYRKLARQHHPDKGGNMQRFQELSEANEVLSDKEKRAYYDKTGCLPSAKTPKDMSISLIQSLFDTTLQSLNLRGNAQYAELDIVQHIEHALQQSIDLDNATISNLQAMNQRVQDIGDRLKFEEKLTEPLDGVFAPVLLNVISSVSREVERLKAQVPIRELALQLLKNYSYKNKVREEK